MSVRNLWGANRPEKLFSHGHLTDEALLSWMDGELRPRAMAAVASHVQLCWSCRGRKQAFEEGILNLVTFHDAIAAPYLPPPEDARAIFLQRLAQAAERSEPSSAGTALWRRISGFWLALHTHQFATALLIVFTLALGALYVSLHNPRTVSAEELLRLTGNADTRTVAASPDPVVVQRVRVRMGKISLERTLYRDVARHRSSSRSAATMQSLSSLQALYTTSSLDWDGIMDSHSFQQWQTRSGAGNDRVTRLSPTNLRLEATTLHGAVRQADVIVRTPDFHIVDETFTLRDNTQLELAELSYTVVPVASLAEDLFRSVAPAVATLARPVTATGGKPPIPRAELMNAAVAAEAALHSIGADLGEQISLQTRVGSAVLISGVVDDQARKRQLVAALSSIPYTRVRVLTIAEAAEQSRHAAATSPPGELLVTSQAITAGPSLLQSTLEARFPDKDQRIAYVNQTLSLSQRASSRSWALDRLADRYPPSAVALLSNEARAQLQGLLRDHLTALREDIGSLNHQLGEVLSGSVNTPSKDAPLISSPPDISNLSPAEPGDWRVQVHRIHSSTEVVHEAVGSLLASSQPGAAEPIEANLRTALTELESELRSLDRSIRQTTLQ